MSNEIKAITLPADMKRRPILRTIDRSHPDHYRKYTGGPLEAVTIGNPEACVYIHGEGMLENLPPNHRAEALIEKHRPGFLLSNQIRGDVVIVGPADEMADDMPVPDEYIAELAAIELKVPDPPNDCLGDGYDFIDNLGDSGWHAVGVWGCKGWPLGNWPLVIVIHYDEEVYGSCLYVEGDLKIQAFETEQERNDATDRWAVDYWCHYQVAGAPKTLHHGILGPYLG